jgi:hypothetical protein
MYNPECEPNGVLNGGGFAAGGISSH